MRRPMLAAFLLLCAFPSSSRAMATVTATAITSSTSWGPTGVVAGDTVLVQPSSGTTLTVSAGAVLTIQPGTVVLFAAGRSLVVGSGTAGSLSAVGTAGQPIEFSSSNQLSGGWGGLDFTDASDLGGATSSLAWCLIRRGGGGGFQIRMTATNGVTLTNCTIADYLGEGLQLPQSSTPSASGCTFHSDVGTYPISGYAPALFAIVSTSTLLPRADTKFNCVQVYGGLISSSTTLPTPSPGFCYVTDNNPLDVRGAASPVLTIGDGSMIKLPSGNFIRTGLSGSPGGLVAHGVVFTSTQDDTMCDATGNGPTVGAPNQWRNLRFESGTLAATLLDGCIVRYGGDTDGYMVVVQNCQPTITNCLLDGAQGKALLLDGTATGQQVSGNLLRNSTTWELSAPPQAMAYLVPNNTLQPSADSKYNGYHLQGATITTSMTLPKPPAGFCYITDGSPIDVRGVGGPVLTIADGTIVKLQPGNFVRTGLNGSPGGLVAHNVLFTSAQDDTVSDTNGNGPSTGAPNQWRNLRFESGTLAATTLDGSVVRYGGDSDGYMVLVQDCQPTITNCLLDGAQGISLRVEGTATGQQVSGNLLRNSTTWELSAPPQAMVYLVPNNTLQLSADSRYNGYHLQGTTIAASMTLPKPPAGFCYITDGNPIDVRGVGGPVLTIADGTILKLPPGNFVRTGLSGSPGGLVAHNVLFTSAQDDTVSDTNGNGPSAGAPNQWRNLRFESGTLASTTVDGCIVRYGGDSDGWMVLVQNCQPTFTNNLLDHGQGINLRVEGTSAGQQVSGNTLRNSTTWELSAPPQAMVYLVPNNTLQLSADSKYNGYHLQGTTISASMTLPKPPAGFCYIGDGSAFEVRGALGPVLTIPDGTILKFQPGEWFRIGLGGVAGALQAHNVLFTSAQDDTVSDTNGNGPSAGAPNQWRNLRFESGTLASTTVDGCIVRYGGDSDGWMVLVQNCQPTFTNNLLDRGQGINLRVEGTSTGQQVSGNTLRNSTTWELSAPPQAMVYLVPNNTLQLSADSKYNGYHLQGTTISASMTLPKPPAGFCYITDGSPIEVRAALGPVLTIADSTLIKMAPGQYLRTGSAGLLGGLIAHGVVFTSTQDDTVSDTNGNGPSTGAPNQWRNLRFESGTLPSTTVDGCIVRNGGDSDGWMVLIRDAQPTLTGNLIDRGQGIGLRVEGTATGQQVSGNLLRNSTTWELSAPPQAMVYLVPNNTLQLSADSKYNGYHLQGTTISASMTLPKPPAGFCYITDGSPIEVRAALGPVLTIADGTLIKMAPGQYLRTGSAGLLGGLMAHGVVFTSTQDDTVSDTNGNGPSTGAPNQWRNLRFEAGTIAAQAVVDGCIVRNGGDTDSYGVLVNDAEPTITRCVIRNSQGYGLYVTNTSSGALITSNLLRDNTSFEVSAPLGPMARLVANNTIAPSRDGKLNGFHVQAGTTSGSIVLPRPAVTMAYYLSGSVTVPAGASLFVPGGCVVKMGPGALLQVQGTIAISGKVDHDPLAPVVFTSYRDDKWWGDTNGDGASTGAAGDWQRLEISGGNNSSVVDGAIFSFGGAGGAGQLFVNGTGAQAVPNVLVKNAHFYLSGSQTGVRTLNANARLDSCSFFGGSTMLGVSNGTSTITILASNSWWGHATGPFDPSGADPCTNPTGLGVGVSDFVNYCPFLGVEAPVTDVPPPDAPSVRAGIAWVGPVPARSGLALMIGAASDEPVSLEFMDAIGRLVRRMVVAVPGGSGSLVRWDLAGADGRRVAPGVYFARFRQGGVTQVRRVVITP